MGVLTGALAIVKKNGTAIGFMRDISATENIARADVMGLGTILKSESPVTAWTGTLTCSFYEVDFNVTGIPDAIKRNLQTSQDFEDQLLLDEEGVQVDVFKKVEDFIDPVTKLRRAKAQPFATIKRVLIESDGFQISEGQLSGHNQSFRYLDPVIYPQ